jgi:bifunctional UDP-N-acetylglucosamine pyrophosphorylase/glucosamine-1-phosphate N-acetyltransferase
MDTPVTVLILAAGLGTRMKSKRAKVLHLAGGRTLIEHVVDTACTLTPPERVFVVTGFQAELVEQSLAGRGVRFVYQAEQKGTGHAVAACHDSAGDRDGLVVVLYGDCPLLMPHTLKKLVDWQRASAAAATLISTSVEDPAGYGRIVRSPAGDLEAIVEQKAATPGQLEIQEINTGIYCFRAGLLWQHIDRLQAANPAGEYYLTDMVEILRGTGHEVCATFEPDARELLGINTRIELAEADRILRERTVRRLMLEGVTIEKPETVTIDAQVRIGQDSVVEPFAQILGQTSIGQDCRIGACSILRDSELGDGVQVAPFTMIASSRLERDAHAGPFARLRMGSCVEAGARVGNFVELKKTRLGAGSKSMHLAYLGDATLGSRVNVGAGTITCNYDGAAKHPTKIGDGAFIGSNSTLVAPVEIGAGSYVAAGSVITEAVPADALALGRARQAIKPGWAKKRREPREA